MGREMIGKRRKPKGKVLGFNWSSSWLHPEKQTLQKPAERSMSCWNPFAMNLGHNRCKKIRGLWTIENKEKEVTSRTLKAFLLLYCWCTILCKCTMYWFTVFDHYTPIVLSIKYWLYSSCCTIYPCSLLLSYIIVPLNPLTFIAPASAPLPAGNH